MSVFDLPRIDVSLEDTNWIKLMVANVVDVSDVNEFWINDLKTHAFSHPDGLQYGGDILWQDFSNQSTFAANNPTLPEVTRELRENQISVYVPKYILNGTDNNFKLSSATNGEQLVNYFFAYKEEFDSPIRMFTDPFDGRINLYNGTISRPLYLIVKIDDPEYDAGTLTPVFTNVNGDVFPLITTLVSGTFTNDDEGNVTGYNALYQINHQLASTYIDGFTWDQGLFRLSVGYTSDGNIVTYPGAKYIHFNDTYYQDTPFATRPSSRANFKYFDVYPQPKFNEENTIGTTKFNLLGSSDGYLPIVTLVQALTEITEKVYAPIDNYDEFIVKYVLTGTISKPTTDNITTFEVNNETELRDAFKAFSDTTKVVWSNASTYTITDNDDLEVYGDVLLMSDGPITFNKAGARSSVLNIFGDTAVRYANGGGTSETFRSNLHILCTNFTLSSSYTELNLSELNTYIQTFSNTSATIGLADSILIAESYNGSDPNVTIDNWSTNWSAELGDVITGVGAAEVQDVASIEVLGMVQNSNGWINSVDFKSRTRWEGFVSTVDRSGDVKLFYKGIPDVNQS